MATMRKNSCSHAGNICVVFYLYSNKHVGINEFAFWESLANPFNIPLAK